MVKRVLGKGGRSSLGKEESGSPGSENKYFKVISTYRLCQKYH